MNVLYLLVLLFSIGCMIVIDRRYRLVLWRHPWRAAAVLGIGIAFFLTWDLLGIRMGIFSRGETAFMTGIVLAPELPLEEPFFLAFLCHLIMVLITGSGRMIAHRRERRS